MCEDVLTDIFLQCPVDTILMCCRTVCKGWMKFMAEPKLWRTIQLKQGFYNEPNRARTNMIMHRLLLNGSIAPGVCKEIELNAGKVLDMNQMKALLKHPSLSGLTSFSLDGKVTEIVLKKAIAGAPFLPNLTHLVMSLDQHNLHWLPCFAVACSVREWRKFVRVE